VTLGDYESAQTEFEMVIAAHPNSFYLQRQAHFYLGICNWQAWKLQNAIDDWRQAVDLDPLKTDVNSYVASSKKWLDYIQTQQANGTTLLKIRDSAPVVPR
jgi:TolA-binding protein